MKAGEQDERGIRESAGVNHHPGQELFPEGISGFKSRLRQPCAFSRPS